MVSFSLVLYIALQEFMPSDKLFYIPAKDLLREN